MTYISIARPGADVQPSSRTSQYQVSFMPFDLNIAMPSMVSTISNFARTNATEMCQVARAPRKPVQRPSLQTMLICLVSVSPLYVMYLLKNTSHGLAQCENFPDIAKWVSLQLCVALHELS